MIDNYQIYLYLGITFFLLHLLIYGISLDLSYFGIILIYIGYYRPILSPVIKNILWILIILDIIAHFRKIYQLCVISPPSPIKVTKKNANANANANKTHAKQ